MKKIKICSLLLVVLLAVMLAPAVFAAGTSVAVSEEVAEPGDEVVLNVTMTGNTGFGSGKYTVVYDKAVLTLVELDVENTLLANGAVVNNEKGIISYSNQNGVEEDGVLFRIKLKVAETAVDGDYQVSVTVTDVVNAETLVPVQIETVAGKVTVQAPHVCVGVPVEKVDADCEEDGMKAHYACACGKLYADEACKTEVTADQLVIKATGHDWEWVIDKEPTENETGLKHEECKNCKETRNEDTVVDKLNPPPVPPLGDATMAKIMAIVIVGAVSVGGICVSKRKFSC